MMRNLGGAVGIAVSAAIINDETNLHFQRIASHLTPANLPMQQFVQGMTERYSVMPGGTEIGRQAALEQLWHLAYREASTMAFADAFRAIMLAFLVATMLVPFMRKVAAPKVTVANAH
jgi:DHA2 family multidrug resistance protein